LPGPRRPPPPRPLRALRALGAPRRPRRAHRALLRRPPRRLTPPAPVRASGGDGSAERVGHDLHGDRERLGHPLRRALVLVPVGDRHVEPITDPGGHDHLLVAEDHHLVLGQPRDLDVDPRPVGHVAPAQRRLVLLRVPERRPVGEADALLALPQVAGGRLALVGRTVDDAADDLHRVTVEPGGLGDISPSRAGAGGFPGVGTRRSTLDPFPRPLAEGMSWLTWRSASGSPGAAPTASTRSPSFPAAAPATPRTWTSPGRS